MSHIDLEPAARRLGALVRAVPDEALDRPTPCPDYRLGDLLDHVGGLALAFRSAATKELGEATGGAPAPDAARLPADWRTRIPEDLLALAEAWRDPEAWTGMTQAGGVDLPGEVAGLVALDELVIHGWDVAQATGQAYEVEPAELEAVRGFVAPMADAPPEQRAGLFGPPVPVPDDASELDRLLGLTGRDPAWSPA
jgi:uncharacterized protein (TIGR03086 family)